MGFIRALIAIFRSVWHSLLGRIVIDAVSDILSKVGKPAVDDFVRAAQEKVAEVEAKYANESASGEVKRTEVFDYLKDYAVARGLVISASVLNFILESSVAALNAASGE